MKNKIYSFAALFLLLALQSCSVVGGIFKAGTAAGVIMVVVVLALIIFVISRVFKK
jgi:hypothetical protein